MPYGRPDPLSGNLPDPLREPSFYAGVAPKRALAWVVDMGVTWLLCLVALPSTAFTGLFWWATLWACVDFLYRWATLSTGSSTWGMRLMAICLRERDGRPLSAVTALLHTAGYTASLAVFPLLLGSVVLTRFDLWPIALVLAALAALVWERDRLGFGVLGLAVAAKLFPAVLVPLALSLVWQRRGRREALVCLGVLAGVVALVYLPFVVLGADGVAYSLGRQLGRPLQIESLGSALFLAAHHLFGLEIEMRSGHGSQNLAGAGPAVVATLLTAAQLGVLAWIWLQRPRNGEELIRWSAAALLAFVALGKVLSPQFLIWLAPLVPLVAGRRGLRAAVLLGVALVLTQLWFPARYWELALEFDGVASGLVLARDLVLVAVLVALLSRSERVPARSP